MVMDTTGAQLVDGRVVPAMGPENYRSFHISAPTRTHWRDASCEEAGCVQYLQGFVIEIDESSALGQFQASYIRHDRTRRYYEERAEMGMTRFTFPPGNRCFGTVHKVRIERPELFITTGGDWRGNPRGTSPARLRPDQWVDEFATHQDNLLTAYQRG
jgi:hypothetical protein